MTQWFLGEVKSTQMGVLTCEVTFVSLQRTTDGKGLNFLGRLLLCAIGIFSLPNYLFPLIFLVWVSSVSVWKGLIQFYWIRRERERLLRSTLGIHICRCSAQPLCQFVLLRNEWPHQKLFAQFDQNLPWLWENSTQRPVGYLQPGICRNLVQKNQIRCESMHGMGLGK